MTGKKTACVIPTRNAGIGFSKLISQIKQQKNVNFKLIIIDSESCDGTDSISRREADLFYSIKVEDFNHGGTRQMIVEKHKEFDYFIFITQDVYLVGDDSFENIIKPLDEPDIGAVCGRQLPHLNATTVAEHARLFNYPSYNFKRSFSDKDRYGIKTAFLSNSFSSYKREALEDIGGFAKNLIMGEDMFAAAKMLLQGYHIYYCADALCRHSHNYTLLEEAKRYFDIGVLHSQQQFIMHKFGGTRGEGIAYLKSELKFAYQHKKRAIIESLIRSFLKICFYKLGKKNVLLPNSVNKFFSMSKNFWI